MFRSKPRERPEGGEPHGSNAGFTLIEALVALAVVAISLTAIGSLMAANIRGSVRIEQQLGLVETARALAAEPTRRDAHSAAPRSGDGSGHSWTIETAPFADDFADPRAANRWEPQLVVIKVRSPSGSMIEVDTVRLRRRATQ